jgi:hypothetical protein
MRHILGIVAALVAPGVAHAETIQWSGYTWHVRAGRGGPAGNLFSPEGVTVKDGALTLAITSSAGGWQSAEVELREPLGYGRYEWIVNTNLSGVDPQAVLGMYTWDNTIASPNGEIDIEAARWGDATDPRSGQFTVQPNDRHRFHFTDRPPYRCAFVWRAGSIEFTATDARGAVNGHWRVTRRVPKATPTVYPHINLWLNGRKAPRTAVAVSLARFTFTKHPRARGVRGARPDARRPRNASTSQF